MIRPTRTWRTAATLAVAALVLSACGGDGDETDTGNGGDGAAGDETTAAATGDGTLTVGTLLPSTGDLAFLGPPEFAGVDLAVQEINEAGGVLDQDVVQVKADSGDGTPNIAPAETDKLLNGGADVVVGAASSSVSLSVIDKITGSGVVQISPANTSTAFDTYDDKGLYFRTAPSDVLQGAVMANMVINDGSQNTAIMARQDSYGEALANQVETVITDQGGTIASKELYDANAATFSAEVSAIAASNPDALVLIAFNETTKIVPELIRAGIGPKDIQIYFVDGNCADYSADFDPGVLEGIKCTYPGAELTEDFRQRLLETDPKLKDFTYGPESYDATIIAALAAIAAEDDAGESMAAQLQAVSEGGTECTEFAECKDMLENGDDIDYQGVSGPIDFNDTGSPSAATIGLFQFENNNTYSNIDYVTGEI
jgi:ABC-type branched-subunit amino acid transport system substrate-binding protein